MRTMCSMNPEKADENTCVACASVLPAKATLCSGCGSFQAPWKNRLKFAASIISLVSLLGAALVYGITHWPDIRKTFAWRESLTVVGLRSGRDITVMNSGDGAVFLSHVSLAVDRGATHVVLINRTIEPSQVVSHAVEGALGDGPEDSYRILQSADFRRVPLQTQRSWLSAINRPCILAVIYSDGEPTFEMYKTVYGKEFVDFPATATLNFMPLKSAEWNRLEISVRALLTKNRRPDCENVGVVLPK